MFHINQGKWGTGSLARNQPPATGTLEDWSLGQTHPVALGKVAPAAQRPAISPQVSPWWRWPLPSPGRVLQGWRASRADPSPWRGQPAMEAATYVQPTVRRCWSAVPLSPAPSRCPHARRHARGPGCPPVLGRQMVGRRGVPMRPGGGRVGSCFSGGPAVVLPLMVVKVFGTSGASTSSPPSVPFCHRARSRLQEGLFPLLGSGTAWLLHRR